MMRAILDEAKSHHAFAAAALTLQDEEIGVCALMLGIANARHESQCTRLFRSWQWRKPPGCYHRSMNRDLEKLRRRPFFFPLLVPILAFMAVVAAAAWLFDARATTVVVVVRHAEAEQGADPDPALSVDGRERAARLDRMLSQARPVRGIDAIFASEARRAQQTVTPLSETLALPLNVVPSATWKDLPHKILRGHRGEYVLVAGHSNTIPALIEALSGEKVTLRDDEYDAMFIVFVPQISKAKVVRLRY